MVFSFRFWWLCNSKHTEGVPMAQLFATGIYTTIWILLCHFSSLLKDKGKKANKFQESSPRTWGCF